MQIKRATYGAAAQAIDDTLDIPRAGLLRLRIRCDRPLKLWVGRHLVVDEDLHFRLAQREMSLEAFLPVEAGTHPARLQFGARPWHMHWVDSHCPSRNRAALEKALAARYPGACEMAATWEAGPGPAVCLRFGPAQFRKDGLLWQEVLAREIEGFGPLNREMENWGDLRLPPRFNLSSSAAPNRCVEAHPSPVQARGGRRFYVPVSGYGAEPPAARGVGAESRLEPVREPVSTVELRVEDARGAASLSMPVFESAGKGAPVREFRHIPAPKVDDVLAAAPKPRLPEAWKPFRDMYEGAWRMLCKLWRVPPEDSGMPCGYVGTSVEGFGDSQFVWDSSFTLLASAYAWRAFPCLASYDCLYSRQEDGGYLHREATVTYNLPVLFEPDFSPNPPLMAVCELAVARLTGDTARLACVSPLLRDQFLWLKHNRRLADGTYWTTGLANGLDNSPSLGEGYPCLTSQMAHFAESLAEIARILGRGEDAARWDAERDEIVKALNDRLWDPKNKIYSTSLTDGGHNPNKAVTAFWPLWAGAVPDDRRDALVAHALDPATFFRHHPLPSLAADAPLYSRGGDYWRGSVWTPTNYAAIKGLWRSGARDAARQVAMRHLECMAKVFAETGALWENYCPEKSERGNVSCRDYSWTAVSPIALLLEVIIGIEPDAIHRRLAWTPWPGQGMGVRDYPLGPCSVSLAIAFDADGRATAQVNCDLGFTLDLRLPGRSESREMRPGFTEFTL